jgi:hypothetical protein
MKKDFYIIIILMLSVWVDRISAQPIAKQYLIGKWNSTSKENNIEINFIDSFHATVNWKGFINNATFTYQVSIDEENKSMLYMQDADDSLLHGINMYLSRININEIKINGFDLLWSRLPLYEDQSKNHNYFLKRKKYQ